VDSSDKLTLAIATMSFLISVIGTILANIRSKEARDDARAARSDAYWSSAIEAAQRFIGFDPSAKEVTDELLNLRVSHAELVDAIDWPELGPWLEVERALCLGFGREVMDIGVPNPTVDQKLAQLHNASDWAQKLVSNLRMFRRRAYKEAKPELIKLREAHRTQASALYEKYGWEKPPNFDKL